jgi:hypothetical protein
MLTSPFSDFTDNTLNAVPGMLGKLEYVAGLRQQNGNYFHWGMARRHGERTANEAIAAAHGKIFRALLHIPLQTLWEEVCRLSGERGSSATEFMKELLGYKEGLLPLQLNGGSKRQFNSVLAALSSLATSPKAERTRRGA